MIQLTNTLFWDDSLTYDNQKNEVKNFIQNVIDTYDRVTTKEAIPNSSLYRPKSIRYELDNVTIIELYSYRNPVLSDGWADVLTHKIDCYAK